MEGIGWVRTSVLMMLVWTAGMSFRIFSTSIFARAAASLTACEGAGGELRGADWTANRK